MRETFNRNIKTLVPISGEAFHRALVLAHSFGLNPGELIEKLLMETDAQLVARLFPYPTAQDEDAPEEKREPRSASAGEEKLLPSKGRGDAAPCLRAEYPHEVA